MLQSYVPQWTTLFLVLPGHQAVPGCPSHNLTSTLQPRSVPCGSPGTPNQFWPRSSSLTAFSIPDQSLGIPLKRSASLVAARENAIKTFPGSKLHGGCAPRRFSYRSTDSLSNQGLLRAASHKRRRVFLVITLQVP